MLPRWQSALVWSDARDSLVRRNGPMMNTEIEREMGRRLRWLRRVRGMTQAAVAAACGVSFQQIQKYETAAARISAGMLLRLAEALQVEVRFFCEGLNASAPAGRPRPGIEAAEAWA